MGTLRTIRRKVTIRAMIACDSRAILEMLSTLQVHRVSQCGYPKRHGESFSRASFSPTGALFVVTTFSSYDGTAPSRASRNRSASQANTRLMGGTPFPFIRCGIMYPCVNIALRKRAACSNSTA